MKRQPYSFPQGYGLGLMVEIFCGIMSGSAWGPSVRKWKIQNQVEQQVMEKMLMMMQVANLGQCFVAIDPAAFTDAFPERLQVNLSFRHFHLVSGHLALFTWSFVVLQYSPGLLPSCHPHLTSCQSLIDTCRDLPPLDPELPVIVPGDRSGEGGTGRKSQGSRGEE